MNKAPSNPVSTQPVIFLAFGDIFFLYLVLDYKGQRGWCTFDTDYRKDTGYKQDTDMPMLEPKACQKAQLAIQDTLSVVNGKWKLVILHVLLFHGKKRFKELSRETGISPRILSKELKELEGHQLVSRTVCDTRPITVEYEATPYSESLGGVITAMNEWGLKHREHIMGAKRSMELVA